MTPVTDKGWEVYEWYNKWIIFPLVLLLAATVLSSLGLIIYNAPW